MEIAELDAIPVVESVPAQFAAAAHLLAEALKAGCQDPAVAYMLALAYKRQGKLLDARAAFRKIATPDANVYLQMGLLSLEEQQPAQAEPEFSRALAMDPHSYEACFNLLMTRLILVQVDQALDLVPRALELAPAGQERRFLTLLQVLLQSCLRPSEGGLSTNGDHSSIDELRDLAADDERRLLKLVRSLGELDVILKLLRSLRAARPDSAPVQEAHTEAVLARARAFAERCDWQDAEQLLGLLVRDKAAFQAAPRATQTAILNLLGCCACMCQDFDSGLRHFSAALKLSPGDARLHQNLALVLEWQGNLAKADPHWNRYFDLLDRRLPAPPGQPDYHERLAFEALNRLAVAYTDKEKWTVALPYMERAHRLRPNDGDVLERLFHVYHHVKRPGEARRTLVRLRELRPNEPQLDLYEIDLIEVKTLTDIDRVLAEIDRIRQRHPDDARVEERAVTMVGNVVPLMANLCEQLTMQMSKVIEQVRRLPNYQINWSAVHDVMRDLLREFQKLRRITNKCLPLVKSDEHRRIVRDLADHIDRKVEVCRQMGA